MLRIPFNPSVSADQTVSVLIPEQLVMPLSDYDAIGDSWGLFYIDENDLKAWEKANGLG